MNIKNVLIFGASGQIGSYLVDYLYNNYPNLCIFPHVRDGSKIKYNLKYQFCYLTRQNIKELIEYIRPDYIFNFISNSSVANCIELEPTLHSNTLIIGNILEAVSECMPNCRVFNAGSELEKDNDNLYALSKTLAFNLVSYYRRVENIFAVQPLIFTSTSPRQNERFLIPKIIKGALNIKDDIFNNRAITPISLGDLSLRHSWGHALDIATASWHLLNLDKPQDLYLSGQQNYSGQEIVAKIFDKLNIEYKIDSEGFYYLDGQPLVVINKKFFRKNDKNRLCSDNLFNITCKQLKWKPQFDIDKILQSMIDYYQWTK